MRYLTRAFIVAALAATLIGAFAGDASAQRRGRGQGGPGGGFGGGFGGPGGGGRLGILMQENARRELELVEDQVDKLRDLQEGLRDRMREEFESLGDFRDMPEDERREAFEKMRTKGQEIAADFDKRIDDILMPEQKEKLNGMVLEQSLRFGGAGNIANNPAAAKALGLSEEQLKQLREKAEEAREKMEKLREESEEELMSVLTPEQRDRVKKLQESQRDRGPGGRRGRGNRNAV